jgi:hypothetical protein
MAGLVAGTRPFEDANDWTDAAVALMGPAPFLDPFARARRAAPQGASA